MKLEKISVRALIIILAILSATGAIAQGTPPDPKRQLVEQKLKLLEMLVGSPAAKASGGGALAERGRQAIEQARVAMADGRFDEAAQLLDAALKSSSESRRLQSEAALSEVAQRETYRNLQEQVETYRAATLDLTKDAKAGGAARGLLARIDALSGEAGKHEAQGRLAEANRILADAYKLSVGEISRLRAGQEVVMSLHFDSPADEYAYEEKRFESGEIMVRMMVGEGHATGNRQTMVENFSGEGRRLRAEAAGLAKGGRFKEAIGVMEQATGQMNRALQTMGVPVF